MRNIILTLFSLLACSLALPEMNLSANEPAETPAAEAPMQVRPAPFNDEVYLVLRTASLPQNDRLVNAEHPLLPVLRYAHDAHERLRENVKDYSCVLTKRERVGETLRPHEMMEMKLRHEQFDDAQVCTAPFSMYAKYLSPDKIRGREALFVEGTNDGDLWVTKGGEGALNNVTVSVDPAGQRAMQDNRYPATEVGMLNLTARLIEEGTRYAIADERMECQVRDLKGAKINGRNCRYIEVKFPVKREGFRFHIAQVFIDEELEVPVRFVSYDWPEQEGEKPPVLEEYTYTEIEVNRGLKDADFDRANPAYKFYVPEEDETPTADTSSSD